MQSEGKIHQFPLPDPRTVDLAAAGLKLTDRQALALLHPVMSGQKGCGECRRVGKLADGTLYLSSLYTSVNKDGWLLWWAMACCVEPGRGGQYALLRPTPKQKGMLAGRAIGLLLGVGEVELPPEWQQHGMCFITQKRTTFNEEAEFKRIHGEEWIGNAMIAMKARTEAKAAETPPAGE
ncbi:MAG: hypothetical protein IT464_12875 [Planctomycetes bacterium]|nr:hypothetical protein [Planctomycetota bacterium]